MAVIRATVNFTAAGLPAGATASFSPSSISASGGAQTVKITITTASAWALLDDAPPATPSHKYTPLALAFLVLFGTGRLRRRGTMLRRMLCVLLLIGAGLAAAGLSGCGAVLVWVPQSYNVTVIAKAGGVQQTAAITLSVHGS